MVCGRGRELRSVAGCDYRRSLAEDGDDGVENGDGGDHDPDEGFVCVFHTIDFNRDINRFGTAGSGSAAGEPWRGPRTRRTVSKQVRRSSQELDLCRNRVIFIGTLFLHILTTGVGKIVCARQRVLGVYRGSLIQCDGGEAGVVVAVAGAGVDGVAVRISRKSSESGFFQQEGPWVVGADVVERREDAANGRIAEQGRDTGPEGREVEGFLEGMIKTVDADGPWRRQVFAAKVHLNGRVDLQQEQDMVILRDQVGAECTAGIHPVVYLPKAFVGILCFGIAVELPPEYFADDRAVCVFVNRPYG